jgi:CheY-like chemotaxis protein
METPSPLASVLVVDDTPANLVALGAVLEPLCVRVVEARSGEEAIEHVSKEAFAVGAADYMTKPLDVEALRARIKGFVDLFEQRERLRRAEVEERTRERDAALDRLTTLLASEHTARQQVELAKARLERLAELAFALSGALTSSEVGDIIVGHGMRAAGADTSTLYVLDEAEEALDLLAYRGLAPHLVAKIQRIARSDANDDGFAGSLGRGRPRYVARHCGQALASPWADEHGRYR